MLYAGIEPATLSATVYCSANKPNVSLDYFFFVSFIRIFIVSTLELVGTFTPFNVTLEI